MKLTYKKMFWVSLVILIISNVFWVYQTIDIAVGHNYYTVSCDEYYKDAEVLRKTLKSDKSKVLRFLENNKIKYESFQKGNEFIIQLNSFDLIYDKKGKLIESNLH